MTPGTLLDQEKAVEAALSGAEAHELTEHESAAPALSAGTPGNPILVQELDRPDSYYYLVPIEHEGLVTVLLSVDGVTGEFHGAQWYDPPFDAACLRPDYAIERLAASPIEVATGPLTLRDGGYFVYPNLVWRPSRESLSPFSPFHMVIVGGVTLYVAVGDGSIHRELTDKEFA